jgi:hypothetical protein
MAEDTFLAKALGLLALLPDIRTHVTIAALLVGAFLFIDFMAALNLDEHRVDGMVMISPTVRRCLNAGAILLATTSSFIDPQQYPFIVIVFPGTAMFAVLVAPYFYKQHLARLGPQRWRCSLGGLTAAALLAMEREGVWVHPTKRKRLRQRGQ